MSLVRISGPPDLVVSLAEAKAQLRLDHADDDALIMGQLRAAQASIDGASSWLGRALTTQQWRLTLDAFPPHGIIEIPLPPLQSVDAVTYVDTDGNLQSIVDFIVYGTGGAHPARLTHASWPAAKRQGDAVSVTFTCGFGGFNGVPEDVRAAVLLMTQALYDGCSHNDAVNSLLMPHRTW